MTTDRRLVAAAMDLLDAGGEPAVTMRGVGHATGVSHNAPYRHFENREALLAAVAAADFVTLKEAFERVKTSTATAGVKLRQALEVVVVYSKNHPARFRLLFSDPDIAARRGGALEESAFAAFGSFVAIVRECQAARALPETQPAGLSALILATLHGLIALEASGRMHHEKGFSDIASGLDLLVTLLGSGPINSKTLPDRSLC